MPPTPANRGEPPGAREAVVSRTAWRRRGWQETAGFPTETTFAYTLSWAGVPLPPRHRDTALALTARPLVCRLVLVENTLQARLRTCGVIGGCLRHHAYTLSLPLTAEGWPVDLDIHEANAAAMTWNDVEHCLAFGACRHCAPTGGPR